MPRVRDLLLRFRPSGSPGPAGPAGVPVDSTGRLADELAPVLAALADTERECTELVEQGRQAAARTRAAATTRADALRAGAAARAEAERAAAASAVLEAVPAPSADGEVERLLAALSAHSRALAPAYLARVTATVEALCAPPDAGPS